MLGCVNSLCWLGNWMEEGGQLSLLVSCSDHKIAARNARKRGSAADCKEHEAAQLAVRGWAL